MKIELSDKEIIKIGRSRYTRSNKLRTILPLMIGIVFTAFEWISSNILLIRVFFGINALCFIWLIYEWYYIIPKAGKKFLASVKEENIKEVEGRPDKLEPQRY